MGSLGYIGALAPQFLGLHTDGPRVDASGTGDVLKQPPVGTEWHSISLSDSSMPELEYRFQLVERKDASDSRSPLLGSKDVSQQKRKLELSLCGMSKYVENSGREDEGQPLVGYSESPKKDCSPYITMEALDSSNGVKEVRVSFHGLEDPREVCTEKEISQSCSHDMGCGDDGCFPLVSQLRAYFSSPKLSCGGLFTGDSKHSLYDGLGTLVHAFKNTVSLPIAVASGEFNTKTGNQSEEKSASCDGSVSSFVCMELPKRSVLESRDLQARCDALPLAHYRPDCPLWCSRDQEQKRNGATTAPNANGNNPVQMNSKKPPKPPKPPRHPGRTSSLDAVTIAAAKAAAARKKALKQAAAKRKARVSAPGNSGGTPVIALVLTLGFGILMVFQGLFVQSAATYNDSDKTFVDVPAGQFSDPSMEKASSYGLPNQSDSEIQSSSQVVDPGEVDVVISTAFYKSMQEIESSMNSQASDRIAASG